MSGPRLNRCAVALALLTLLGCGSGSERASAPQTRATPHAPAQTTCAELATRSAARRLARRLVDDVVAPEGQSRRETADVIAGSLHATCSQPELPGVDDPADYRPVRPVLEAVQQHFDEEEISGE